MLDEHRFGHDGTHAGPGEPSDGRQHMQKKNGQLAHRNNPRLGLLDFVKLQEREPSPRLTRPGPATILP